MEIKIEPMEPTFETLNLDNDKNPRLIKIGLALNEQERKISKNFSLNSKKCLHGLTKIWSALISR